MNIADRTSLVARLAIALLTTGLVLIDTTALAADKKSKPYATSTRDELRACMNAKDELEIRRKNLATATKAHDAAMVELQRESKKVVELQRIANKKKDEPSIDQFNTTVTEQNEHVAKVNQQGTAVGKERDAYNADMLTYNEQCATRAYNVDDREAILKEREASGLKPSESTSE